MEKDELILRMTAILEAKNTRQSFSDFARAYMALMPDGAVNHKSFSEAYKSYKASNPGVSFDYQVRQLSKMIQEATGLRLRLIPGTRTGNRPGRKPKKATVEKPLEDATMPQTQEVSEVRNAEAVVLTQPESYVSNTYTANVSFI